jgi:hypothetical protein
MTISRFPLKVRHTCTRFQCEVLDARRLEKPEVEPFCPNFGPAGVRRPVAQEAAPQNLRYGPSVRIEPFGDDDDAGFRIRQELRRAGEELVAMHRYQKEDAGRNEDQHQASAIVAEEVPVLQLRSFLAAEKFSSNT